MPASRCESVIKEIDKTEVRSLIDFGKAVKASLKECNFTVGTYEPADPGDPVGWGVNFHFVGLQAGLDQDRPSVNDTGTTDTTTRDGRAPADHGRC